MDILAKKLENFGAKLSSIKEKVTENLDSKLKKDLSHLKILAKEWVFLQESEVKFKALMADQKPPITQPGSLEFGPALYIMNNLPELLPEYAKVMKGIVDMLRFFGLPQTTVSDALWNTWLLQLENQGVTTDDGSIIAGNGCLRYLHTYVQLDPGWVLSAVEYFMLKIDGHRHAFGTTPAQTKITKTVPLTLAIVGDWGTGIWNDGKKRTSLNCPSQLVMDQVAKLAPDITIHLGDVYYAGTEKGLLGIFPGEEKEKFVDLWKAGTTGKTFTLNSNHEMYNGAEGYFDVALGSKLFSNQQNTSFFSIEFGDWLLVGVDSAYFDPSTLFMEGALFDPKKPIPPEAQKQLALIKDAGDSGRKLVIMTHHTAMDILGKQTNLLWDQMVSALGRAPEFWYWGHVHNGIVYNASSAAGAKKTRCRCSGHAAIPFGDAYALADELNLPNRPGTIDYYAHTPMPNPEIPMQEKRVLNGFTILTLDGNCLIEEFWEVSNDPSKTRIVWSQRNEF